MATMETVVIGGMKMTNNQKAAEAKLNEMGNEAIEKHYIITRANLNAEEIKWIDNYLKNKPAPNVGRYIDKPLSTDALRVLSSELGEAEVAHIYIYDEINPYYQIFYGTLNKISFPKFDYGTPYLISHVHGSGNVMPSQADIKVLESFQAIQKMNNRPVQTSSQILPIGLPNSKFNSQSPTRGK